MQIQSLIWSVSRLLVQFLITNTTKDTVISPIFLVLKFLEKRNIRKVSIAAIPYDKNEGKLIWNLDQVLNLKVHSKVWDNFWQLKAL